MIYILDFQDSFTYNIFSEVFSIHKDVEVIRPCEHLDVIDSLSMQDLLILGPGPGNPDQYKDYFPLIKKLVLNSHRIWGICLGHQIIARSIGLEISHCERPIHGLTKKIQLTENFKKDFNISYDIIDVQSYNSLCFKGTVKNLELLSALCTGVVLNKSKEVEVFYLLKTVSVQFHPESVGTSYRKLIFEKILKYLL